MNQSVDHTAHPYITLVIVPRALCLLTYNRVNMGKMLISFNIIAHIYQYSNDLVIKIIRLSNNNCIQDLANSREQPPKRQVAKQYHGARINDK